MKPSPIIVSALALCLASVAFCGSGLADEALNRQCDILAASGLDIDKLPDVEGIARDDIDRDTAIPACEAAMKADPDNAHIIFNLARALDATNTDQVRATQLYQQAAEGGSIVGMLNLGRAYEQGNGVPVDAALGFKWQLAAAEKGLALAQDNVGNSYRDGQGVARDYKKAMEWYRKAEAQGYIEAVTDIGFLTEMGWGVERDLAKAAQYYQRAVDGGEPLAMNNLGHFYEDGLGVPKDIDKARKLYEDAVDGGNIDALNGLGYLHDRGLAGLPLSHEKANDYYRQAMEAGSTQGMSNLGQSLILGEGIQQNVAAGLDLLHQAEAKGNSDATIGLAEIFRDGKVVTADLQKAADHYLTALENGSHDVFDLLVNRRAASLSPDLVDQLQLSLKTRGKTFTPQAGSLSDSAIKALQELAIRP